MTAAEGLLRERPLRELTVDEVMRRTDLSRPSFYVYFRDRHHLVLKVVERIGSDLFELADTWYKGGKDGPSEIRLETSPGDYVFVPPYVPHREENPTGEDAVVIIARSSQEGIVVNLPSLWAEVEIPAEES